MTTQFTHTAVTLAALLAASTLSHAAAVDGITDSEIRLGMVNVQTGLAAMLDSKPDAIVMVGPYAPLAVFIKEARAAGLKSQLATVSFVGTDNLVAEIGKAGDGVLISPVVPVPADDNAAAAKDCRDLVNRHAGGAKLGCVNFEGCLTAQVMVRALQGAGKDPTRASLVAAMDGMQGIDLGGVMLNLSATNHQAMNQVFLTQVRDGQIAMSRHRARARADTADTMKISHRLMALTAFTSLGLVAVAGVGYTAVTSIQGELRNLTLQVP